MNKAVFRQIVNFLVFAVFIVSPFICFADLMYRFSENSLFGMFIRYVNAAALPVEIFSVAVLNIAGFLILKNQYGWGLFAFVWLLLQAAISIVFAVLFIKEDIGVVGENILINDIVTPGSYWLNDIVKSDSYWHHSMILMGIFNVLSFFIVALIFFIGKIKKK